MSAFPCLSQAHAQVIAKNAVSAARENRGWFRDGWFEARSPQGAMDRVLAQGSRAPSPPPPPPAPAPKGMDRYMQKQKPPPVPPPRAPKKPSGIEPFVTQKKPRVAAAPPASPGAVAAIAGIYNLNEAPPASPGTMAHINAMEASEAGAAPAPAPSSPAAPPAAVPPPQSHTNAADEDSWACPACTYRHEGAEAGFLQCSMCGGEKDAVVE